MRSVMYLSNKYVSAVLSAILTLVLGTIACGQTGTVIINDDYKPLIQRIDEVANKNDSTASKVVFLLDAGEWADARTQKLRELVMDYVRTLRPCDQVGLYLYRDKLLSDSKLMQPVQAFKVAEGGMLKVTNLSELESYSGHTDPFRALADLYNREQDCVYVLLSRMASADKPISGGLSKADFEAEFANKLRHEAEEDRSITISADQDRKSYAYFDIYKSVRYTTNRPCTEKTPPGPVIVTPPPPPPPPPPSDLWWLVLVPFSVGGFLALRPMRFSLELGGVPAQGISINAIQTVKKFIDVKNKVFVDDPVVGIVTMSIKKSYFRDELTVYVDPTSAEIENYEGQLNLDTPKVLDIVHGGSRVRIKFTAS